MIIDHDTGIEQPKPSLMTKLMAATLLAVTLFGTVFAGLILLATGLVGVAVLMLAQQWQTWQMNRQHNKATRHQMPNHYAPIAD